MRKRKSGYKQITEKDFNTIKALLSPTINLTGSRITEITGRSQPTISLIKKVESFDAYKALMAERNKATRENTQPAVEPQQQLPEAPITPAGVAELNVKLDRVLELSEKIATAFKL